MYAICNIVIRKLMMYTNNFGCTFSYQTVKSFRYVIKPCMGFSCPSSLDQLQQGLEIRGFWFQKKTVQLKTALLEVYTYVLKGIFFSKNSVSPRLLAKIRVCQGYCYVVQ